MVGFTARQQIMDGNKMRKSGYNQDTIAFRQ
jgi:hypothetical protein